MHANYSDKKMQRRTNIMKDSGIIPIWERYLMTVIEASEYYHIGENKLRNIIESDYEWKSIFDKKETV